MLDVDFGEDVDYDALAPADGKLLPKGYISTSQVSLYTKCPHQYYLRYIERLGSVVPYRMFEGVAVHHAVEAALKRKMQDGHRPPLDEVTDTVAQYYDTNNKVVGAWEGVSPEEGKDRGVILTRAFWEEGIGQCTPIAVEEQFTVTITGPVDKRPIPFVGRLDSIQVKVPRELADMPGDEAAASSHPRVLVDLKVTMDAWTPNDIRDSLQLAIYANINDVPDVRVDQLVKGRGKKFKPYFQTLGATVPAQASEHALEVVEGAAKAIMAGVFPKTDPSNWWCSAQWCGQWHRCRGKNQ